MEISSAVRAPEDGGLGLLATGGELVARFVATTFRASRLHFSSQECCEHRDFYSHHGVIFATFREEGKERSILWWWLTTAEATRSRDCQRVVPVVWVEMEADEEPPKKEGEVRALMEVCGGDMEQKEKRGARTVQPPPPKLPDPNPLAMAGEIPAVEPSSGKVTGGGRFACNAESHCGDGRRRVAFNVEQRRSASMWGHSRSLGKTREERRGSG